MKCMWKTFLIGIVIVLFACNKQIEGVITPVQLHGINDTALYSIDKSNKVITVVKPTYLKSVDYDVKIEKDTIVLAERFIGLINVYKSNFIVRIESPIEEVIIGDGSKPNREFLYTPSTPGLFYFKGVIEYGTTVVPFEYKFIVVKKD